MGTCGRAVDARSGFPAPRHCLAALLCRHFGLDALSRVRGFSPPEMALPNHPEVFYEFVRTLKDSGYRWVLVQEHWVERVRMALEFGILICRTAWSRETRAATRSHHGHH